MSEGLIAYVLAALEGLSLSRHVTPALRKFMERRRLNQVFTNSSLPSGGRESFIVTPCRDENMAREIFRLKGRFFAEATGMNEEAMIARYRQCSSAFNAVLKVSDAGAATLAGYFVLVPISSGCIEAISLGQIEAGRHIRQSDIAPDVGACAAYYISVVCGTSPRAQVATVNGLLSAVSKARAVNPSLNFVFVRPTTALGLYSLIRNTGREYEADGKIQRIDLIQNHARESGRFRQDNPAKRRIRRQLAQKLAHV